MLLTFFIVVVPFAPDDRTLVVATFVFPFALLPSFSPSCSGSAARALDDDADTAAEEAAAADADADAEAAPVVVVVPLFAPPLLLVDALPPFPVHFSKCAAYFEDPLFEPHDSQRKVRSGTFLPSVRPKISAELEEAVEVADELPTVQRALCDL